MNETYNANDMIRDPPGKPGAVANNIRNEIQRFAGECHIPPTEEERARLRRLGAFLKTAIEHEKESRGEPLDPSVD